MPGVLDGYRVLDLTVYQLGPVNTTMLALLGADVIKIEPPTGEPGRINTRGRVVAGGEKKGLGGTDLSSYFEANNQSKRSLVLDLRRPKAREVLYQLVAKSDVFAQNISPGSAEKLGAGYETLKKYNPKLIYYTGTSFGTKGPDGYKPGMALSGTARSGWSYLLDRASDGSPTFNVGGSTDQIAAIMGAFTICLALMARERFGIGQYCESSHLTASMWFLQCAGQMSYYQGTKISQERAAASRQTTANPIFNAYKCKDGEWLALVNPVQRHWAPVCAALDIPDALRDDPRFKDPGSRAKNSRECIKLLDEYFARFTLAEMIVRLEGKDINWEKVQRWEDLPKDPQILANEYISFYQHELTGRVYPLVNLPMKLAATPTVRLGRAPLLGEHTAEILTGILGYKSEEVPALIKEIGEPVPTFSE
jgi:crotonobetainyl-CoA:carnitine CoA-transferase CaiB-like acyl-CoA transferase